MKRMIKSSTWVYNGPAFDYYENYLGRYVLETQASTEGRAKSNIQFKIRQTLGLKNNAVINLDLNCLKEKNLQKKNSTDKKLQSEFNQLELPLFDE